MNETPKWLFPAALAAAVAAALWWLFTPDNSGRTGAQKLRKPVDPNAALGAAVCEGGIMYYGGATAGLGAAPLCTAVGQAVAPIVKSGVNTAVDIIDAHGTIIKTAANTISSGISDSYNATKTVAGDTWDATKTVAGDTWNFSKDAAGWVTLVTPAKKVWNATLGKIF